MCLLIFAPKGETPNSARLEEAARNNPDGFGFAIHAGDRIVRHRGMNFDQVMERFTVERAKHAGPAMFHLRIATHGTVNTKNCHPFYVGNDSRTVLGHNGIIPVDIPKGDQRSDTKYFSEVILPSHGGISAINSKKYRRKLGKSINGSKLVILSVDPNAKHDSIIVNEELGHWDDGIWWSNKSYQKWVPAPSMHTYGYAPWSPTDTEDYEYAEFEDGSFTYPCPMCEELLVVNCDYEEVLCPTCDVCVLCGEQGKYCTCTGSADRPYNAYLLTDVLDKDFDDWQKYGTQTAGWQLID